jgi:hypothetical protein
MYIGKDEKLPHYEKQDTHSISDITSIPVPTESVSYRVYNWHALYEYWLS